MQTKKSSVIGRGKIGGLFQEKIDRGRRPAEHNVGLVRR
jgi:hypothetical protein